MREGQTDDTGETEDKGTQGRDREKVIPGGGNAKQWKEVAATERERLRQKQKGKNQSPEGCKAVIFRRMGLTGASGMKSLTKPQPSSSRKGWACSRALTTSLYCWVVGYLFATRKMDFTSDGLDSR